MNEEFDIQDEVEQDEILDSDLQERDVPVDTGKGSRYDKKAYEKRAEKVRKQREALRTNCTRLLEIFKDQGVDVPADIREWLENSTKAPKHGPNGVTVGKMFGKEVTEWEDGMRVSLMDAMTRTLMGKAQLDAAVKKWSERPGKWSVVFEDNAENVMQGEYVVTLKDDDSEVKK